MSIIRYVVCTYAEFHYTISTMVYDCGPYSTHTKGLIFNCKLLVILPMASEKDTLPIKWLQQLSKCCIKLCIAITVPK